MKKFSIFTVLALFFGSISLFSQTNNACDGKRYRDNVFAAATMKTIQYATGIDYDNSTIKLSMDVYQPTGDDPTVKRPVVILAHGGSFITGNKSNMATYCQTLAKKGYVAVSMQYRLYPWFLLGFPDSTAIMDAAFKAAGDMKACVRFFRADAAATNQFNIDPENIFIGGYSAGAVTAGIAGYLKMDDDLPPFIQTIVSNNGGIEGNTGDATNLAQSSKASLVMSFSGGLYRKEMLDADEPPLYSIHGTADDVVPYISGLAANVAYLEGSGKVHPYAKTIGLQNYLETCTGGDHVNMYNTNSTFASQVNNFISVSTAAMEAIVCGTSSADDVLSGKLAWSVFPNPTSGSFSIQFSEEIQSTDVQVFDLAGRQVARLQNVRSGSPVAVDFGKGVFFLKSEQLPGVLKIVVQ